MQYEASLRHILTLSSERDHFSVIHESLNDIKERLAKLEEDKLASQSPFETYVVAIEPNYNLEPSSVFQNEPSFNNQSAQASLSAELSTEDASANDFDLEIQSSLTSLKSLLRGQNLSPPINDIYFPISTDRLSAKEYELPPASVVIATLKKASGTCLDLFLRHFS